MAITDVFNSKQVTVLDQVINNNRFKLMINYGAKRSGKTFVDNYIFLMEVRHAAEIAKKQGVARPQFILAGATSGTIDNNILTELYNQFGLKFHFDKHNAFPMRISKDLPPVKIVQAYTKSVSGVGSIRGMTAYGAYVNEATEANPFVFREIMDRCSAPGARVICDTNPDIPTHWLKTDYVDKALDTDTIIANKFTIYDNTYLDKDYLRGQLETTPKGMYFDRNILGLWVSGEGMVYSDFNKDKMVISKDKFQEMTQNQDLTYYMGVDWGYEHMNSIQLWCNDENGISYRLKETDEKHQPIDHHIQTARDYQQYVRDVTGVDNYSVPIYADSARPDNVNAFTKAGLNCQFAYKQNILKRVEIVSKKIYNNSLRIVEDEHSDKDKLVESLYQYVWNDKTGEPLKQNGDDPVDCMGYAVATQYLVEHAPDKPTFEEMANDLSKLGLI